MKPIILTQEAKDKAFEIFKNLLETTTDGSDLKINITTETLLQAQGVEKPIVYVTSGAYIKMMALINSSSDELAWYGIATRVKNNYLIEDILVYPQTVTTATVDADEEKCAKWFMELPDEVINNLKFQGHSHVNMAASPSGRDTNNWLQFANLLKPEEFMILCIGNKRNEFYWNIYDKAINVHFENKDITMAIIDEKGNSVSDWAKESIDKYIEKKQPVSVVNSFYYNNMCKTNLPNKPVTNKTDVKNTVQLNGREYEVSCSKTNKTYETMLSYIPDDLREDVDYEPESDTYFTYTAGLPNFEYSNIYDCYMCPGKIFRTKNPKNSRPTGRPKKEKINK